MIGVNLILVSELHYLDESLKIALEHGITLYDSLYIALALREEKPLLSLDAKQRQIAEKLGVHVLP